MATSKKEIASLWEKLKNQVNERGADGEAFVEAMKDYYSIYTDGFLSWLGALFDPKTGGFYYSNSARDNECAEYRGEICYFLPDIESTNQALNVLQGTKLIDSVDELPEWMRKKIADFVCSLQSPDDGYIHHPQWKGRREVPSRISRDLAWAVDLQKKLGFKLPYPTAYERLEKISKGEASESELEAQPEELRSKESFLAFVSSMDWQNNAYVCGNRLSAQSRQIMAAGLTDVAVDFVNDIQNEHNGLWGKQEGYMGNNALMKITCFYDTVKRPIPRATLAVREAMKCLVTDEVARTSCYNFNVWYSILNIMTNLRRFGGEDGAKEARAISDEILKDAPKYIRATKEKILTFRKEDGSFSILTNSTSPISQGMPVAVEGTNEGDVNAATLNSGGTCMRMFCCFGLDMVPIYSEDSLSVFLDAVKK
jgi:hypothetical protein